MNRLIILLALLPIAASAQNPVKSPYSRFGIGEIQFGSTSPTFAMGGVYTAWLDTNTVNFGNPASYSFIAAQRPVFDVGIAGHFTTLSTSDKSAQESGSGLRNIVLGLPVSRRIGAAIGLTPFSAQGYEVTNTILDANDKDIDFVYSGDGGINRLFAGLSYAPVYSEDSKLAFGANFSYVFGNLSKERSVIFEDNTFLHTNVRSNVQVRDIMFDFGLLYEGRINNRVNYSLGATYALSSDLNATRDELATSFVYSSGQEVTVDTLEVLDNSKGFLRLPMRMSYGAIFNIGVGKGKDVFNGNLRIGAQYSMSDWSQYLEVFGSDTLNDKLQRSNTVSLGFEYLPLISLAGDPKYINLIRYRGGIRFNQSQLVVGDYRVADYGISFGVGLPLVNTRSTSSLNLGVELGKRGTTDNNLIQEDYVNFFIGFSLSPTGYNRWFVKRKYD